MTKVHQFEAIVRWTGNTGSGTTSYKAYDRTWDLQTPGKPVMHCSNDPGLGGDPSKYNPEDMLIAALSSCHMLWYLHLCAVAGVVVVEYVDRAGGTLQINKDGSGQFISATLRPQILISARSDLAKAKSVHNEAHQHCFIARSVNFPVGCDPAIAIA